ncbi:MAG: dephospho-CoA kinase [Luteolibacter sp.]
MQVQALTGGIASGKSTACRLIEELVPRSILFDCDASVHAFLETNSEVAAAIKEEFGAASLSPSGEVDRSFLRQEVFSNPEARARLEAILHPRVRQECLASLEMAAKQGAEWFVADVPLLFEKGFDFGQTQVIVIASSGATQIKRLKARNGFEDSLMESILQAQLPLDEKIARADIVFWNEGPQAVLESQIRRFYQVFP